MCVKVPAKLVETRAARCSGRCNVDPADPCVACPNGHWVAYVKSGCSGAVAVETPMPPLISKAKNIVHALARTGKATVTGKTVRVSDEEKDRRLAICATCEFYTGTTCRKCGCVMRFKARLATEHCPISKW